MGVPIPGKSSWPELLGVQEMLAVTAIASDRPDLAVEVIPPSMVVTPVNNPKRVRIYIDDNGLVSKVMSCWMSPRGMFSFPGMIP
jgi:hypothetical protein